MSLTSGWTVTRLEMKVYGYFHHMYRVENDQLKRYIESLTKKPKTYSNFHFCWLSDILRSCNSQVIDEDNINRSES